jgi:hypothetical protein
MDVIIMRDANNNPVVKLIDFDLSFMRKKDKPPKSKPLNV